MPFLTKWKTGVYCWKNNVSGKVYVGGATRSFQARRREYRRLFRIGKCHNKHLQAAWNLYGSGSFEFTILERCSPNNVADRETYWITKLKAANAKFGYNTCPVGFSRLGVPHTEEARAKMSATKKGMVGPRTGAILSKETKEKIAASKRGKLLSEDTKAKMSAVRTGKRVSKSHLASLVATHWSKGPRASEIAARISAGNKGKVTSQECRDKISATKLKRNADLFDEQVRQAKRLVRLKAKGCSLNLGQKAGTTIE